MADETPSERSGRPETNDADLERTAIAMFEQLLDVDSDAREAWIDERVGARPELRDRLLSLLSAQRRLSLATGGAITGTDPEIDPPEQVGAYRLTGLIGRGGMGSVYRAERTGGDFDRQVAVKIIKPGLLSRRLVERFAQERQILASLEHPNIAHLYDGGATEDGSPYFVMELVDGEPLRKWLETTSPSIDERLRLFREVCDGVAFAHRNLVVHRDLTPSNILVTRNGNAKLIDFGIAKRPDAEASPEGTSKASLSGLSLTPGYAAPERRLSRHVSTAADIYSLGKVLETLIGVEPVPELAAIAAKATAAEPEDRYASASELAEEVERFRGELPVAAFSDKRSYRFRKFVKRERAVVLAVSALFIALALGLAVSTWSYVRAERQRALAEKRFEQTRSLAKLLLFDVYDEASRVPGSTRLRVLVAGTGLEYLDALANDRFAPSGVRAEVASGYIRLADVTGSARSSSMGKLREGGMMLQQARAILEPLYKANPTDASLAVEYSDLLSRQALDAMYNNGRIAEGRALADAALAAIGGKAGASPEAARTYLQALTARGDADGWDGEFVKASKFYERAEGFAAALPANIATADVNAARAHNYRMLAESYHHSDREPQALAALDHAVALNERLYKADPNDPRRVRGLIVALWYSAVVDRTDERTATARQKIDRAMQLVTDLQARNPGDIDMITLYSTVAEVKAQILADRGAYAESYALTDRIVALNQEKVRIAEDVSGARRSLAEVLRTGGTNRHNGGDYPGACRLWTEAYRTWLDLDAKQELSKWDKESVAEMKGHLAQGCNPPRKIPD